MFKKNLQFKEDKQHMKILQHEVKELTGVDRFLEDSQYDFPPRGRQMKINSSGISKKNLNTYSKASQTTTSQSKSNRSGKALMKYNCKKNRKFSKRYHNSSLVNEQYESSDSDYSLKNYKRRALLEETKTPKGMLKSEIESIRNNSEDNGPNDDMTNYIYNFEENLKNKIEGILNEIYSHHIYSNTSLETIDISKYEEEITSFSTTFNKQLDGYILKILLNKIKKLINNYKDELFEIEEIKQIRDRYYYNNNFLNKKEVSSTKYISRLSPPVSLSPTHKLKHKIINKENQKNVYLPKPYLHQNDKLALNGLDNIIINILLPELRNIKQSLINSAKDIEQVFREPLSNLRLNNKILKFSVELMHREEFTNILIKDEFISCLLAQVKTISREQNIEKLNLIICQVEENIHSNKTEMMQFINFLSQIENEELNNFYQDNNESDNHNSDNGAIETNFQHKISDGLKNSYSTINENKKIPNDISLDQLVEYIEKSDKKEKKSTKKKIKKKNIQDKKNIISSSKQSKTTLVEEVDDVVEMFKKELEESLRISSHKRKIKPQLSKEWVSNLLKN